MQAVVDSVGGQFTDDLKLRCIRAIKALEHFNGDFAKWRWQTLFLVTKSFLRLEDALQLLREIHGDDLQGELGITREAVLLENFLEVLDDPAFWHQTRCLYDIVIGPAVKCYCFPVSVHCLL